MTGDTQGALVALAAFAVMGWLNRRPNDWWEGRPRPNRPPTYHRTPVQARIIRSGSGQELERRNDR